MVRFVKLCMLIEVMRVIMYLILFLYLLNVVAQAIRLKIYYVPPTKCPAKWRGGGFIVFCVDPVGVVLSCMQDI